MDAFFLILCVTAFVTAVSTSASVTKMTNQARAVPSAAAHYLFLLYVLPGWRCVQPPEAQSDRSSIAEIRTQTQNSTSTSLCRRKPIPTEIRSIRGILHAMDQIGKITDHEIALLEVTLYWRRCLLTSSHTLLIAVCSVIRK